MWGASATPVLILNFATSIRLTCRVPSAVPFDPPQDGVPLGCNCREGPQIPRWIGVRDQALFTPMSSSECFCTSDTSASAPIIKGGMCISGMYDLTPVRLSARNAYVAFDDATVAALSPIRYLDRLHAPLVVAYGTCETPEFQRQNREFAAAVKAVGKSVQLLVGENYNHFELPETLGNPYGLLGRAALDLMGLTAGLSMIRIGLWSDRMN
jgi:hypothetical protein